MNDIADIRSRPEEFKLAAVHKNIAVDIERLLQLDEQRRELLAEVEQLRVQRNTFARHEQGQKLAAADIARGKQIKQQISQLEDKLNLVQVEFRDVLAQVPNIPTDDTPIGASEADNVIAKTVGEQPKFDFEPLNHWQLGESLGLIDKKRAAKVAGARFAYLKGGLVRLHFALIQYGISVLGDETKLKHIAKDAGLTGKVSTKPFIPVLPPAMARTEIYRATGRLDSEEQTYKLADDELWLNASAEHTLAPMFADEILTESDLPARFVGYTTAFRREAGSYGKDMEGILRLHQFDKLEMESFTTLEDGLNEHHFMVAIQEYLMSQLELPYQVTLKCTADIGKPNARGVDIDTWLPGQQQYRETHTADYMTDFQARSLNTRVRRTRPGTSSDKNATEFVATNDATVFSMRPLIAILENYQQADGSIRIPAVLQTYYGSDKL